MTNKPYTEVVNTDTRLKFFGIYTDGNPAGILALIILLGMIPIVGIFIYNLFTK